MNGKIFLNYRRADSGAWTLLLRDKLISHFGHDRIFHDLSGVPLGERVRPYLASQVAECAVMVAVIGPHWLSTLREREASPGPDHVLIEIEAALALGKPIIPVLAGGARMPLGSELPNSIADLSDCAGTTLSLERMDADVSALVAGLNAQGKRSAAAAAQKPDGTKLQPVTQVVEPEAQSRSDGSRKSLVSELSKVINFLPPGRRPPANWFKEKGYEREPFIKTENLFFCYFKAPHKMQGTFAFDGELIVEGHIVGDIYAQCLVLEPNTVVDGTVTAKHVEVRGGLNGNAYGDRIMLRSTASVEGNLHHQSLAIEQGAFFEGKSRRGLKPEHLPSDILKRILKQ